uniref:Variant surface glycoprotein 739 n=1 Tax=Trypanosoma brucei TaxID=5691 RepID=M4SZ05_9TRYP|nr:variant surface glycoprotein 739 [Trypanosoma brucei]
MAAACAVLTVNEKAIGPLMTTAVCDTDALFRKKPNTAIDTAATAKTRAADNAGNILKLKVLASKETDPHTRRQILPIILAGKTEFYKSKAQTNAANAVARVSAAKYSAYILGNIDEYLRIAGHAAAPGTAGCFAASVAGAGTGHRTYGNLKTANQNCKAADLEENPSLATAGKFTPGSLQPKTGPPDDTTADPAGCKLHAGGNSTGHIADGAVENQNMLLAGGLFKIGSADIAYQTLTELRTKENTEGLKTLARAFNAVTPAEDSEIQTQPVAPAAAAQMPGFIAALTRLVNAPKQLAGDKLHEQVKALYGKPDQDLKEKLWQKMSSIKAPTDHDSTNKGKSLQEIADISLLTEMLSNATIDAATQVVETTSCKDQSKELDDEKNIDEANQKMCEKFHDKPKECPDKTCTYETKTKKCNPIKSVEGEQATEKGDGAAGTTPDKCKGKLEPECTKAPECKWESETCKDSGFIVNKKFTLITTAFMKLLPF